MSLARKGSLWRKRLIQGDARRQILKAGRCHVSGNSFHSYSTPKSVPVCNLTGRSVYNVAYGTGSDRNNHPPVTLLMVHMQKWMLYQSGFSRGTEIIE